MSANLGFIVNAAERDTHIFASESSSDRLSKAGLTHARRAVEADDRRLHITLELEHSKILDNPLLHLVKTVMILIKNLLRILEVKVIDRHLAPRKVKHELYIIILYAVVR